MKINKKLLMAALASAVIVSAPQVKAYTLSNAESVATNTELGRSEEKQQAPVRAPQKATDPNYLKDEKKVGFYKDTQLERGNGPAVSYTPSTKENEFVDGFRYKTLEPSGTSDDKTLWGFEIEFDREKGQRTYTDFSFTNTGNLGTVLNAGTIPSKNLGEKLDDSFKEVNYKSESEIDITASGRQLRNLNLYTDITDLEHINSINNKNTVMAWEGHYTKDNPNGLKSTEGDSAAFNFTVNPWPNENDQLDLIYLNGDYEEKQFVKGQTINTGIKVENLDDNARERLVGQVYHPVSGEVVPGAEAYIDENDMVVVKMPEGALKTDAKGKTVINEDSIFSKAGYKNIQSLDVKFFTRPRTEQEFRKIAVAAQYEGQDYYTPTGAGTEVINHKGESVTIDKQGIPRYDHYNKVGEFKLNLDDTMYYDQRFEDGNGDDTTKITSSAVQPDDPFEVKIVPPANPGKTDKSASDMNGAEDRGEASGELILDFIEKENKGKAEADKWKVDYDPKDISKFTVTAPASAKAGDFVAVALKYTYTNGSTDTHWFHFVVQESTYIKPEYETQVNFPTKKQTSPAQVTEDGKRIPPSKYTLPDTLETDEAGNKIIADDEGKEWTVTIDEKTGLVSAQPINPNEFDGGEKLTVPVIAHYVDEQKPGEDITEEVHADFVIEEKANMTPRYNAKAGKSGDVLSSDVILNTEDTYNRRPTKFTLDSDTFVDDKGNTWSVTIDEKTGTVTAKVPNAQEGQSIDGALLNVPVTAHYYEENGTLEVGTKKTEVQFVASGTDGTYTKTQEIPFETKVEKDPELKKGQIKVITEGKKGSKEVTYVIKDSQIDEEKTSEKILEEPQDRLIHVGEGVNDGEHKIEEKVEVPYEVEIQFDDSLKSGEQVVFQEGEPGEKTRTTTITIQDGNVTNTQVGEFTETKAPKKKIIKVGANTEGKVEHVELIPFKYDVQYDPNFYTNYPDAKDNYKVVTEGVAGEKTTTWTIKNSEIVGKPEVKVTKEPVDAVIKVGKKDYTGAFETKKTKTIEFETKYVVDNSLEPGTTKVEQEGELGEEVTTVKHTIVNGEVTKSEDGETIRKEPKDRIVKVGPGKTDGTHEYTNKIPYEVEIRVNPKLKKGERNVIQKGEAGEEKYTLTIENSKVTNTTGPVRTKEPKPEIIEVGTEDYTGEFEYVDKEVIPFDTEVKINPNLEPNQIKEITPGENGSKERKITQKYVNGEKGELVVGDYKTTKEPVTRVIEVGPGKTDGTHTYTSKKPFEVEVRVNPELKKGEYKVVQKGVEGEEEYTITIENSKVTNTSEPKQIKAPVKEIIEVGNADFTGTVEYVDKDPIPFETEVTVDPSLKPGEIVEDQKGELGEQETKITRTITNGQAGEENRGETTRTKEPVKRKIRVGSKTDGQYKETETIPFEVEVRKDPSLKKGEWKYAEIDGVQQTGESGLKERTITIVNSKVTEESEFKTTREPKKAIILVGEESTDGVVEHKEEIPFEYTVEYDPDFYTNYPDAKDNYKIVTEGVPGEKITKWTIKDSEVVGKPEENITKEPVNGVIKVGQKDLTGTFETKKTKAIEYETEYIEDETLEPGKTVVEQEGELGEEETKVTLTIENGKVIKTEEGTPVRTKEPVKKIVRVGKKPADPTEGETTKTIEREIPYETKVIYDDTLEAGFQKIEKEGKPGKEEVTITQKIKDSKPVGDPTETTKTITEKEDRVVRVGVKPVVKEVELGNDTEYRHNPELKEGETKVIEEGSKGSVKYTTTFNKETGKLEVTEERVEPTNKVVEYGSKTDGEFTYESEQAYDIIVRENPNLEAGKVNVIQEGIVGKTETTVKIENSKEVSRDTKTITEKQDKIIEIGTKNVCEIPPVDPDPETPGKPGDKDPETPGKPGDKDPETPGKPGDKDPENPDKPGDKDPENPDKPGDKDPENPDKPGDKDPETPGKPGDKDPGTPGKPGDKDPETPGEDPKDPDKDPGKEDPKDPETPGKPGDKDPETPGKPGDKDPETPGKPGDKDPETPDKPGGKDPKDPGKTPEENGKTPENNGKTPENNGKTPGATGQVDGKSTTTNNKTPKRLPKSGSESEIMTLAMSGLLTAAGFIGLKKKRKDK